MSRCTWELANNFSRNFSSDFVSSDTNNKFEKNISGLENVDLASVFHQDSGSRKLFTNNNIGENWKETSNLPTHICRFNTYFLNISNFYSEIIFEIMWFWHNLFKLWDVDVSTFIDVCFINNCFHHIFNQLKINKSRHLVFVRPKQDLSRFLLHP